MGLESESGETSCEDLDGKSVIQRKQLANILEDDAQNKVHRCNYSDCKASFRRPWRLAAHICTHTGERPYKCVETGCNKAYTNSTHLRRHIGLTHRLKYKKTHKCPHDGCSMELSSTTALRKHYKRIHESSSPYTCQFCDEGFKKHNQLKTHMFQHTGVAPYKSNSELLLTTHNNGDICCNLCPMSFTTLHALKRHQRGHRMHACNFPECARTFNKWTDLRKHYKLDHPIQLTCNYCGKVFKTKSVLKGHLQVHQEPKDREVLPCPYEDCHRFYYHIQNLTHHIRSSHEGKKHKCPNPGCERQLCTRVKLREHMKLHDPKRPLPTSKRRKPRKMRCDAGTTKRSMAVKLSGVVVPYEVEKAAVQQDISLVEKHTVVESPKILIFDEDKVNYSRSENENILRINSRLQENLDSGSSKNNMSEPNTCPDTHSHLLENVSYINNNNNNTEKINSSIEPNNSIEQVAPLDLSTKISSRDKTDCGMKDITSEMEVVALQDECVVSTNSTNDVKRIIDCNPNVNQGSGIPMALQKWIMLMLKVMDEFYPKIKTDDQQKL